MFPGEINAVSPEIDAATRNIRIQAKIANGDENLRPACMAPWRIVLPPRRRCSSSRSPPCSTRPSGDSVFVVSAEKDEKGGQSAQVLRQQFIRVGGKAA